MKNYSTEYLKRLLHNRETKDLPLIKKNLKKAVLAEENGTDFNLSSNDLLDYLDEYNRYNEKIKKELLSRNEKPNNVVEDDEPEYNNGSCRRRDPKADSLFNKIGITRTDKL